MKVFVSIFYKKGENHVENEKIKKDRYSEIVFLIIIILMLLIFWLGYRIGRIGYKETMAGISEDSENLINIFEIQENNIENVKENQLNIFNNKKFEYKKIIAPRSNGSYKFAIKNESKTDVNYDINFSDENQLPNMKYKLKIENLYIKGSKENYISIEELNVKNIIILKNSIQLYTLEWYWEDNDPVDTYVGSIKDDQFYQIVLKIDSREYREKLKK